MNNQQIIIDLLRQLHDEGQKQIRHIRKAKNAEITESIARKQLQAKFLELKAYITECMT